MALPLAILVSMVTDRAARESAIRTYATIASMGAVVAPVVGGWLVQALGWRSVFFVNVPLSLFVLYAGFVHTTESPRDPSRKVDLGGQITSAFALIAFAFTVIEGNVLGWKSPAIFAGAVLTIAFGLAFVMIERRAEQPMIRFSLLREPLLSVGVWNMLAMNIGFFTLYLIASLFIQDVRRVDALTAGWFLLSNNLLFFLSNQFSGRVVRFLGEGGTVLAGMGLERDRLGLICVLQRRHTGGVDDGAARAVRPRVGHRVHAHQRPRDERRPGTRRRVGLRGC